MGALEESCILAALKILTLTAVNSCIPRHGAYFVKDLLIDYSKRRRWPSRNNLSRIAHMFITPTRIVQSQWQASSYYAALLPRRGPHIASHSVCPSVCPTVPLSLPSVTSRHLANYNDTHVLFGTRWGPHIVRPSRPHKFLLVLQCLCCLCLTVSHFYRASASLCM